jgi:hypothetical protein
MPVTLLFTIFFIITENKKGKAKTRKVNSKENSPKQKSSTVRIEDQPSGKHCLQKSSTVRKEDQPSGKYCFYLPPPGMSNLKIYYSRHSIFHVSCNCLHTAIKDQ